MAVVGWPTRTPDGAEGWSRTVVPSIKQLGPNPTCSPCVLRRFHGWPNCVTSHPQQPRWVSSGTCNVGRALGTAQSCPTWHQLKPLEVGGRGPREGALLTRQALDVGLNTHRPLSMAWASSRRGGWGPRPRVPQSTRARGPASCGGWAASPPCAGPQRAQASPGGGRWHWAGGHCAKWCPQSSSLSVGARSAREPPTSPPSAGWRTAQPCCGGRRRPPRSAGGSHSGPSGRR